ncbi:MAG: peptide-methionine (S)-S-oxide reductase MsrA [Bacteroidia bacterium]|nr:peptide-methionine (S)-S-oxide reductase MsrA [Bacteroidia bacterium]
MNTFIIAALFPLLLTVSCGQVERQDSGIKQPVAGGTSMTEPQRAKQTVSPEQTDTAVFGAGCFWCVEAVFEQLDGVISVDAGYAGGHTPNPTYEDVCTGETGHAEVARIVFDPAVIRFDALLEMFWQSHDPTTLNRQGADVGTQYRSVIFYIGETQREQAIASMKQAQAGFDDPIVTEISPLPEYFPAENYHQDYYRNNRNAPYCQVVIRPKLKKLGLE